VKTKQTKIIATISDKKCDPHYIKKLFDTGMDAVRINTAFQSLETTRIVIDNIRKVSEKIAIILDTQGPEVRTTETDELIPLKAGDTIKIKGSCNEKSTAQCICVSYEDFQLDLKSNSSIIIENGELELKVLKVDKECVDCEIVHDGILGSKKTINVPGIHINLPALNDRDKEFIKLGVEMDVDFISHSFCRNSEDLIAVKRQIDKYEGKQKIIAKIENQAGVDNLNDILDRAYGVMVARGDLGVEISPEKIPSVQRKIVKSAIDRRKPVITSTQMLQSMIHAPRPTRAEVTDIANAIYQGTDAIMLSGVTALGKYPVEAVQTLKKIAIEVESTKPDIKKTPVIVLSSQISAFLTQQAIRASIKLKAKAILADSRSGRTIRNLAAYRGKIPIHSLCYTKRTMRELAISYGVFPSYFNGANIDEEFSHTKFINQGISYLMNRDYVKEDDLIVVIAGNFGIGHGASFIEISSAKNISNKQQLGLD